MTSASVADWNAPPGRCPHCSETPPSGPVRSRSARRRTAPVSRWWSRGNGSWTSLLLVRREFECRLRPLGPRTRSSAFGRRAVDHGAGGDVEPGAVALAHDRRPGEQPAGERASLVGARADVVERVEAVVDARDRDPLPCGPRGSTGTTWSFGTASPGPTVRNVSAASSVIVVSSRSAVSRGIRG